MKRMGDKKLDVTIVGGGPAGLSAALVLGRCMRQVLICDAGEPRNAPARIFNGYLSRDGSTPGEFQQICREQLCRYETVELRRAKVTGARRNDGSFTVTLEKGDAIESRMLLLATGVVDELPQIEGFPRFYGKSAHSCPLCDGWEHRGEAVVVTGGTQEAADLAIEMLLWSKDVALCTNGPLKCDGNSRKQLERGGIRVIENPISKLEGEGDALAGVRFADGSFLPRTALFFSPGQHQKSPLAEQLGCEFCQEDGCIQCDEKAATCIPNLYAAGNASRGVQMVIAAAAEGALAGVAINNALLEADADTGGI